MAAGEFAVAEKKLIKALDHRPDDSELWWSLMLCKCGFRNDAELEAGVKSKYESAADRELPPPPTPFDTSYCKNALKYATSTRRRDFVDRVSSELSDIWLEKRGKALKAPKTKVKAKPRQKRDNLSIAMYTTIALSAIGGVLGAYAVFDHATWALWTGYIAFIVFAVAAFILRMRYVKSGGSAMIPDLMFAVMFMAVAIVILIAGVVVGSRSVIILAVAILVLAVLVGGYRFMCNRSDKKSAASGKTNKKGNRSAYDRSNVIAAANNRANNKKKREVRNEYKDEDD